jgi:hypothetical protein
MRRHLKSRYVHISSPRRLHASLYIFSAITISHNGKTPETLLLPDVQIVPSTSSRGKRRACSQSDTSEFSGSDGEHQQEQGRSASSSRAHSAAPPYYDPAHHAAPPPNNLSPAILYQAAMSYEIRHALAPSSSPSSSLAGAHGSTTSALRTDNEDSPSRRIAYNQPPDHEPFTQYPTEEYPYQNQHPPYVDLSHPHPQHFSPGGPSGPLFHNHAYTPGRNGGGPPSYDPHPWSPGPESGEGSPDAVKLEDVDVTMPVRHRDRVRGADHSPRSPFAQQEPLPSGLAALAMHAARIRPMSPLPEDKQAVKTKSELESALGPSYAR